MKTKIVCMGDSITEGFMVEEWENYPYKLGKLLGEDYEVINKGQCSTCVLNIETNEGLMGIPYVRQDRYKEALEEKGDIYLIMLGTNDAQDGMDDVEDIVYPLFNMISRKVHFKEHYLRIVEDIQRVNEAAKIYVCLPIPVQKCIWRKHKEEYLADLREIMKEMVAQKEGLNLIDVYGAFAALPKEVQLSLYREDMLHPNPKGYDLLAETIFKNLHKVY